MNDRVPGGADNPGGKPLVNRRTPPVPVPVARGRAGQPRPRAVRNDSLATVPSADMDLAKLLKSAAGYAKHAKAKATVRAYTSDWRQFTAWCATNGQARMPAEGRTVAAYLAHLADTKHKVATIERALVAISQFHRAAREPSPRGDMAVQEVMKGIRRKLGTRQTQKEPVLIDMLKTMVATQPPGLMGVRNAAILVLGFSMGCRRAELMALDVEDLRFVKEGLVVTIRRSKTDQEAKGREVPVPYAKDHHLDATAAVRAWLDASGITTGPVFRRLHEGFSKVAKVGKYRMQPAEVARIVKLGIVACRCGDPRVYAGHSLRAGLVTEAIRGGKSMIGIKRQTGHKSEKMIERYFREVELFNNMNALQGLM